MIRRLLAVVVAAMVAMAAPAAAADEVPVAVLIADSAAFDGAEVTLRGELIGDFQLRSDGVWVQLNGDAYVDAPLRDGGEPVGGNVGVAVRIPTDLFDGLGVETPGGYRVRGPVVRVTGEWRHHDEARGGESYLQAVSAEVLESERRLDEEPAWWAAIIGMVLLVIGATPVLLRRRRAG